MLKEISYDLPYSSYRMYWVYPFGNLVHFAAAYKRTKIIEWILLNVNNIDNLIFNVNCSTKDSLLSIAVKNGDLKTVNIFINNYIDAFSLISAPTGYGYNSLHNLIKDSAGL